MADNHVMIFAKWPEGMPSDDCFEYREAPVPTPKDGEVLLRAIWLSVDPYLRGRMTNVKSYAASFQPGSPIYSHLVAEVADSKNPGFAKGDVVMGIMNWAHWQTHSGEGLAKVDRAHGRLSHALGVLGMPGMTAWAGLNIHGQPKEGETIVVSAATGAVGSLVAQLAKRKGLRVVGVAGGPEKCAYAVEELGCDACLDHRDPGLAQQMAEACPKGVDIYFENVGGATTEAALPLMNTWGRVPICGMISGYNATAPYEGPDRFGPTWRLILTRRLAIRGFIIFDHWDQFPTFQAEVGPLVASGEIKTRETVTEGLENAPEAFRSLLKGTNFGKAVVKVGEE